MNTIINFVRTDAFLISILTVNIILTILYITNCIRLHNIRSNYLKFVKKLGNGENIEEILRTYIRKVEDVEGNNKELEKYCKRLDNDISKCIQKVGILRYSAFKDTGSDLSFTLALLDQNNDGVVLNGIYSREMSNIYAKPIKNGNSTYTVSEEEKEAIKRALNSEDVYEIRS